MPAKTAIIIGAGPAGLTAAEELLEKTDIRPLVFERSQDIGGISRTVQYKGNRMDIGGHRFFSKSDRVMQWWLRFFPLQGAPAKDDLLLGREIPVSRDAGAPDPEKADTVMLARHRVSRIYFERAFYDYPISLSWTTAANLGLWRILKTGISYGLAHLRPLPKVDSLEAFLINRFGRELYRTFFRDYTEKVWGIPCSRINPEWGEQRIKGLSLSTALRDALRQWWGKDRSVGQRDTETSLIKQFLYPKFGPGQLWEHVARTVQSKGGQVLRGHTVVGLKCRDKRIVEVVVRDEASGATSAVSGDYVFSTMPVAELIESMNGAVPDPVRQVARGLVYRDFITTGLLLERLRLRNRTQIKTLDDIVPDQWIYIQERDVKLGRLQIFNNWSPYMVRDIHKMWVGLEYFCQEGDSLWSKPDEVFADFAAGELARIGIIDQRDVLDHVVVRVPKTYPAYFGTYDQFGTVRAFVDGIANLFLIGRNGMHRYNNQDHSMLTAMTAVENIINNVSTKDNIWAVNAEKEYHEEKQS